MMLFCLWHSGVGGYFVLFLFSSHVTSPVATMTKPYAVMSLSSSFKLLMQYCNEHLVSWLVYVLCLYHAVPEMFI